MLLIGLVLGALSGYGLGFLGLFGRIVCSGLLFLHAIIITITILSVFIDRKPGDPRQWIGAGGLTEYLIMTLAFDTTMIVCGRLAGVSALSWRWVGGGALITLACAVLLRQRYLTSLRRHFAAQRPD